MFSSLFSMTTTTDSYTLSLHDALPISFTGALHPPQGDFQARVLVQKQSRGHVGGGGLLQIQIIAEQQRPDRKSTRLNSSHPSISYAVFCLKKKIQRNP